MNDESKCSRCGRIGTRGFADGVCTAVAACDKRIEEARSNTSVYRWETQGGKSHAYKLDGERLPGVTTLTGAGLPKPFLVGWGINSVSRYAASHLDEMWAMRGMGEEAVFQALRQKPYTDRNEAGARGTTIHAYAERLMRGDDVDVPPELLPWVEAVVAYLDEFKPTPVLQEVAVGSRKWKYCGTLDDVSDFPDGRRRIVDYKSGKGIYDDGALQLAAYANPECVYRDPLTGEERSIGDLGICEEGYQVHIRPEGYEVVPFYVGPEVLQAFLRVAWVGRTLLGLGDNAGLLSEWRMPALTSASLTERV